jgi:hypothetical protein
VIVDLIVSQTKAGENIFLNLGFNEEEAQGLYAESQQQINTIKTQKEQLKIKLTVSQNNNIFKRRIKKAR